MNTPFTSVTGPAVPLMRPNVDSDVIIHIECLTMLSKAELGLYAFEALRRRPDASEDPDCVLNRPNLQQMRSLFLIWPIRQTVPGESSPEPSPWRSLLSQERTWRLGEVAQVFPLPWSAYVWLLMVGDEHPSSTRPEPCAADEAIYRCIP